MKILMLSSTFPYPPTRGGTQVRTFNLLKYLSQRHAITLITQRSEDITDTELEELRKWVEELLVFPQPQVSDIEQGILAKVQRFKTFLQQGTPPSVLYHYSSDIQEWLDEAVKLSKFEVITCEHSVNEIYVRPEWQQQIQLVVNIHSSVYGTCRNQLETGTSEKQLRDQLNLPLLRRYEAQYCSKFTKIVVTTPEDRRQMAAFNPDGQIAVIPNGVDLTLYPKRPSDPGGYKLVFIGAMDTLANIDAARFFSLEVFPEIVRRYPEATLDLVGTNPVELVVELGEHPRITVTGRVPSVVEYLHQASVCVVPLRTGYGIKNKTLEAMAAGTPVVGSDRGLEGLAVDGADVPLRALRANETTEYVYAISRLFEDRQLRKQLSENARSLIEKKYTWERAGELYEQVLSSSIKN
ncbi:Glycosyltransferase [uncultured Coleofasciculus sp.]|uniref:Glycosyltransferase n=1 Tax=uncultured Coleofasciculus sp. TaxID=1267456 RepID=A0A6J4JN41_9CYAN|nr:Glycosyltransferase [uncultured Coleofasciculus sp.]